MFPTQDIYFCPEFFVTQRNALIRKLWSISNFLTPQTGQQIITIHILSNISRGKSSQAMKFGQSIFFFKNHEENEARRLDQLSEKALYMIKTSGQHHSLNIFSWTSTCTQNKNKFITFHSVGPEIYLEISLNKKKSTDTLNFHFFIKGAWDLLLQHIQ